MSESPFKPGARVAVNDGWGSYREAFVDKVHKTGRFTLRDDKSRQQWRPYCTEQSGTHSWHAAQAGDSSRWRRGSVIPWDEKAEAAVAKTLRAKRVEEIYRAVGRVRPNDITDDALSRIEAALGIGGE